jgi:hypothetical protein
MFADAAGCHALVLAFDDYADAFRSQDILNAMRDLCRHRFLNLEPPREGIDYSRELADTDHFAIRQITDMCPADYRCHMVFTMGFELNVPQNDHLIVAINLGKRASEKRNRVFLVAAAPVFVGTSHAAWRAFESFTIGILTHPKQQCSDCGFSVFTGWSGQASILDCMCGQSKRHKIVAQAK